MASSPNHLPLPTHPTRRGLPSSLLDLGIRRMHALPPLLFRNTVPPIPPNIIRIGQHIQRILQLIRRPLVNPKQDPADERQQRRRHVIPHEQRVLGERDQRLADGIREGRHEVPVRGDDGAHVLGGLCERVLEASHGCEDLGETHEDVGHGLDPDVERGADLVAVGVLAAVHVLAADGGVVDVVLDDGCGDHCEGGEHEAEEHALDGGELDALLAEEGVEEVVDDGDEDDEGDGVEVSDDVVGDAVEGHGRGLGHEVVVHLVVGDPW